jgi:hypothetical protein
MVAPWLPLAFPASRDLMSPSVAGNLVDEIKELEQVHFDDELTKLGT